MTLSDAGRMRSRNIRQTKIKEIRNGCRDVVKKEEDGFPDFIPESRLQRSKD